MRTQFKHDTHILLPPAPLSPKIFFSLFINHTEPVREFYVGVVDPHAQPLEVPSKLAPKHIHYLRCYGGHAASDFFKYLARDYAKDMPRDRARPHPIWQVCDGPIPRGEGASQVRP